MKSEPSSAMQKETGSWTSGSWAKMAQESGATGAMEGGVGAVGIAAAARVAAGAVPDWEADAVGRWVSIAAAKSGSTEIGVMIKNNPRTKLQVCEYAISIGQFAMAQANVSSFTAERQACP